MYKIPLIGGELGNETWECQSLLLPEYIAFEDGLKNGRLQCIFGWESTMMFPLQYYINIYCHKDVLLYKTKKNVSGYYLDYVAKY
jgi:hypothetical protein